MNHKINRIFTVSFLIILIILEISNIFFYNIKKLSKYSFKEIIIFKPLIINITNIINFLSIIFIVIFGFYGIYTKRLKFIRFYMINVFISFFIIIINIIYNIIKKNYEKTFYYLNIFKGICYIFSFISIYFEREYIIRSKKSSFLNKIDENLSEEIIKQIIEQSSNET
jgi:hypothetical protein